MNNDNDFWDFAAFWEFFNPFEEEKGEERTVNCPVCNREFDDTDKIEMVDTENKVFKCPDCGAKLEYDETLGELAEVVNEQGEKDPFVCKYCGKRYKRIEVYEVHDASAKAIYYKCFGCENKFRLEELEEEERRRKLMEEIFRKIDASGICFPIGPLMSGEKFVCRVKDGKAVFYLDLITLELKARCKNDIIKEMVGLFTASGIVKDGLEFYKRLLWRECICSADIGQGIALPNSYADLAIEEEIATALAIIKEGVDFDSFDEEPVRIIFMSANRPYEQIKPKAPHLAHLAMLSRFLKSREHRQALLAAKTKEEVFLYLMANLMS